MKVNLGCGDKHLAGWVNCDINLLVNPDKVVDANKRWDFADGSVSEFRAEMLLEHVQSVDHFFNELSRVLKYGGKFSITFPNAFFWRMRLRFLFGRLTGSCWSIWHCWILKPSTIADLARVKGFGVEIRGSGLLPFPDLFFYRIELVGTKRRDG